MNLNTLSTEKAQNTFSYVMDKSVLNPAKSTSAVARAFYIPWLSARLNKSQKYTAFSKLYR